MCSRLGAGFTPGKIMPFYTPSGRGIGTWGFNNGTQYNARFEGLSTTWRSLNQNRGFLKVPSFWEREGQFQGRQGELLLGVLYNRDAEFAVITVPANEVVKPFHHRMPLILTEHNAEKFLKGELLDVPEVEIVLINKAA